VPGLGEEPQQLTRLVGGDTAADAQHDVRHERLPGRRIPRFRESAG
jgi:hypothetical protein